MMYEKPYKYKGKWLGFHGCPPAWAKVNRKINPALRCLGKATDAHYEECGKPRKKKEGIGQFEEQLERMDVELDDVKILVETSLSNQEKLLAEMTGITAMLSSLLTPRLGPLSTGSWAGTPPADLENPPYHVTRNSPTMSSARSSPSTRSSTRSSPTSAAI
jgi:hypothetical protein